MNDLITAQTQAVAEWNGEQLEILKRTKFKDFTDHEIRYCAEMAKNLRLNVFLNQVHFVRRKNVKEGTFSVVTQVGIDGLRLIADRSGAFAGTAQTIFEKGSNPKYPSKAIATVYKIVQGVRCEFVGEARWEEFADQRSPMWDKMPFKMLEKCAMAQALRTAFPAELSAVYAPEEISNEPPQNRANEIQNLILPKVSGQLEITQEPESVAQFNPENSDSQEKQNASLVSEEPRMGCLKCGGSKLMISKYDTSKHYCMTCKNMQPIAT